MKRLVVRSIAESDIREAAQWFTRERGRHVAIDFLDAVEATFDRIREQSRMFAVVEHDIRRAPVARFPYGVFYVDGSDSVSVLAVMHLARDPATWERRR
ncbi:MAG: type II toxin-antitoxin system RelE/ParE family toxin [Spirochaetales bacterium]